MIRTVSISAIALGGLYILFPVAVLFAVLWLADVLISHDELKQLRQAEQSAIIPRPIGPEIPQCDKPLWDRVKDGCPQEDSHAGP
jgi:hypothetical protein